MSATKQPLRAAIIGCGAIAYEHLPYLSSSERCRLVGVCDQSKALAEFAAQRFKADGAFADAAEMLAKAKPDVVHVLTPPQSHATLVRMALDAGANVICEKPMTGSEAETRDLLDHAASKGKTLVETRNYLFNDTILEFDRLVASGRLGKVVECDLLLSLDFLAGPLGDENLEGPAVALKGGAIHDFVPHLAYLFLHYTGLQEIENVRGTLANRSGNKRAGKDFLDALATGDGARGRLRIATDVAPDMFRLVLRGTEATVEADLYNPYIRFDGPPNVGKRTSLGHVSNGWKLMKAGFSNFTSKVRQHGTYHGIPRMLDAIYASVQEGKEPPFSREDIIATARFVDRLLELSE